MLFYNHGIISVSDTNLLNSTQSVTCGFQPKAIRFTWSGINTLNNTNYYNSSKININRGVGFAQSTTSRSCVSSFSTNGVTTTDCGSGWSNTSCVMFINGAGAAIAKLDINSIDVDGFTLIVDQALSSGQGPFLIKWEAWGGSDITNVTIGAIAEPSAVGTQNYTATGFVTSPFLSDQCVMIAGVQSISATDVIEQKDSGLCMGFATSTSTSNNIVLVGNSDDASVGSDTDGYNYTGECSAMITIAGGATNARAVLSGYGADLFILNWTERATTSRRSIYMAIKGGLWSAGSTTIAGNTLNSTATLSGFSFRIRGGCLMGAMKTQSTQDTSTVQDRISYGSFRKGLGTTNGKDGDVYASYLSSSDVDASGTSICSAGYSEIMGLGYLDTAATRVTEYQVSGVGGNSTTLITSIAGGVANEWIGYLVFGDNTSMTSVGHPFIV